MNNYINKEVTIDTPSLTQSNKRVSLSFKRRGSHGVAVIC